MALQDLTPQLRTRLSRVERAVGLFVMLATALLLAGFAYYTYHMAERKGWFLTKLPFHTFLRSANGLKIGDPIKLLGFDAGEITRIEAMPPFSDYGNVYIEFIVKWPHYGYIWDDSRTKVTPADFLGKRYLELIPGGASLGTNLQAAARLHPSYKEENGKITGMWDDKDGKFVPYKPGGKGYTLMADEAPAVMEVLGQVATEVKNALPGVLNLTNQLNQILANSVRVTAQIDALVAGAQPAVSNLTAITANLREPKGAFGEWLLPTNVHQQLLSTLASADKAFTNAQLNLDQVSTNLNLALDGITPILENLANLTSNLNAQVQANSNILGEISAIVMHTDDLVQGLKHHWLLRSAFKGTNRPALHPPSDFKPGKLQKP